MFLSTPYTGYWFYSSTTGQTATFPRERARWACAKISRYPEAKASPGGYLHRTGSFRFRSGRHAHVPGSSNTSSCCCNGSVGLNWHTGMYLSHTWRRVYFYPSAGGLFFSSSMSRAQLTASSSSGGGHEILCQERKAQTVQKKKKLGLRNLSQNRQ